MTLNEWLDEPQTVTTRRERMVHFVGLPDDLNTRRMMMEWLAAAWNAGIDSGQKVPRDDLGRIVEISSHE